MNHNSPLYSNRPHNSNNENHSGLSEIDKEFRRNSIFLDGLDYNRKIIRFLLADMANSRRTPFGCQNKVGFSSGIQINRK